MAVPFLFRCQFCKSQLTIKKEEYIGKSIPCPRCKKTVVITAPRTEESPDSNSKSPAKKPRAESTDSIENEEAFEEVFEDVGEDNDFQDEWDAQSPIRRKPKLGGKKKKRKQNEDARSKRPLVLVVGGVAAVLVLLAASWLFFGGRNSAENSVVATSQTQPSPTAPMPAIAPVQPALPEPTPVEGPVLPAAPTFHIQDLQEEIRTSGIGKVIDRLRSSSEENDQHLANIIEQSRASLELDLNQLWFQLDSRTRFENLKELHELVHPQRPKETLESLMSLMPPAGIPSPTPFPEVLTPLAADWIVYGGTKPREIRVFSKMEQLLKTIPVEKDRSGGNYGANEKGDRVTFQTEAKDESFQWTVVRVSTEKSKSMQIQLGRPEEFTSKEIESCGVRWHVSPDGAYIVAVGYRRYKGVKDAEFVLSVIEAETATERRIPLKTPLYDSTPTFIGGRYVVFDAREGDVGEIYKVSLDLVDGTNLRTFRPGGEQTIGNVIGSPIATKFVVNSNSDKKILTLCDAETGESTQITTQDLPANAFAVSDDGLRIFTHFAKTIVVFDSTTGDVLGRYDFGESPDYDIPRSYWRGNYILDGDTISIRGQPPGSRMDITYRFAYRRDPSTTPAPISTQAPAQAPTTTDPSPPPTPQQQLAQLYEQIRVTRAECLAVYEEMMAAPGQAPSKKGSLADIDQRVWKLTRARLEFEASGKVTLGEIEKIRAEDEEIRTNRTSGHPGDTIDQKLEEAVIKFCNFRPETPDQMSFYHEIATAARLQYMQFSGQLPPELAAFMPDRAVTALPPELSMQSVLEDLDKRGVSYGRDHVLTLVVLFPPTNRATGLVHKKVQRLIPKIAGGTEMVTQSYVYTATAPQLAVVYRVNGIEDRKEFSDIVSLGNALHSDHERGIYMFDGRYLLTERQDGVLLLSRLKNPDFVWDGFRPTAQHILNGGGEVADDDIVIRFDFGVDDIEFARKTPAAVELLTKFQKKYPDWNSAFAVDRGHLFAVVKNPKDFDDLVKDASRITKVLAKNPERRTMVLKTSVPKEK